MVVFLAKFLKVVH